MMHVNQFGGDATKQQKHCELIEREEGEFSLTRQHPRREI